MRSRSLFPRCVAVFLASVAAFGGCADGSPPGAWGGSVDTLASGRVVVRSPDAPLEGEWRLEEDFRLGSLTVDGPELFGSIAGLALDPGDGVLVLDGQAQEIRQWDAQGRYLRTFGRAGEGPGELAGASGLALDDEGTVWVLNWRNARYTGFDARSGALRAEQPRAFGFVALPWAGAFADGRLVDMGLGAEGRQAFLRLDRAFVPHDTLPLPPFDQANAVHFRRGDVPVASVPDPFTARSVWAVHPRGGIVGGDAADYRLVRVSFAGDTTHVVHLDRPRLAVSAAERDSALAAFEERAAAFAAGGTANRRPRPAAHHPAYDMVVVDDQARLWVRAAASATVPPTWDVFGADGRYLARVPLPHAVGYLPPVVRGNRMVAAVEHDGLPTVVVYTVIAGTPN